MPVLAAENQESGPTQAPVKVRRLRASWDMYPPAEHTNGSPREPGYGARLAVRKFGSAINKLAEN